MNTLSTIVKAIPLMSAFLILISTVRLTIYYGSFNVEILNFIDLSETIKAFIDQVTYYTLFFMTIIIFSLGFPKMKNIQISPNGKSEHRVLEEIKDVRKEIKGILIVFTIIVFLIEIKNHVFDYPIELFVLGILLMVAFLFFWKGVRIYIAKHSSIPEPMIILWMLSAIYFPLLVSSNTIYEIYEVKIGGKYSGLNFEVDNTLIISDSSHYYIGQTNKYVFYFNELTDETTIFPIGKIDKFIINN